MGGGTTYSFDGEGDGELGIMIWSGAQGNLRRQDNDTRGYMKRVIIALESGVEEGELEWFA